ncbi:Piso0_005305 [Millerozyma farinosa CBS 7064]|uniref:Piso0_005305 protein n=1 Tax=Pichia sorbitophila (strain ATCC MYA-4447 / BCRC 22081 / CBS 7064 / NBRC 10061 / NRRL Y-12695) TaxID=559304 RepID=G8Y1T9_PICSO|nr:Piso0_005305 [Millerozyma farinosa CBS 7064]
MLDQTDVQVTEVPKDIGKTHSSYLGASVKQGHKIVDRYSVPSKKADVNNSGGNLGFYYSKVSNTTKEVSGRFSFHCRNILALVVGNTVYGALEVVNFTVERSEKGKELLK